MSKKDTQPTAASAASIEGLTEAQISAGARAMSDYNADICGVDREDNWKIFGSEFIDEARLAFKAAGLATQSAKQGATVPVAYLKFWAAQYSMGEGNIGVDEGLEVCGADEIGMDGVPAFPVYAHPAPAAPTSHAQVLAEDLAQEADFELMQDDMLVASTSGKNAFNEILQYAAQYVEDGPVELYKVTRSKISMLEIPAASASNEQGGDHG